MLRRIVASPSEDLKSLELKTKAPWYLRDTNLLQMSMIATIIMNKFYGNAIQVRHLSSPRPIKQMLSSIKWAIYLKLSSNVYNQWSNKMLKREGRH